MGCRASLAAVKPLVETEEFHSKYSLEGKIGRGCYAQVHSAHKRTDSATGSVAVKISSLHSIESQNRPDKDVCLSACTEIHLWSRVGSHRNCVRMYESFADYRLCYIVMERCSCSLIDHIKSLSSLTEKSLAKVFTQMLQGIAHIHSLNIVHRDIKPDNYLVGGKHGETIKLGDFGLAAHVKDGCKVEGVFGSAPYMCPEMIVNREADLKADVWSFGVVAYLLLCGKFPYYCKDRNIKSMMLAICKGSPPDCNHRWLTPAANAFLAGLLQRDPDARASASFALSMQYITKSSKTKLKDCADLRPMLVAASSTGAFESPGLKQESNVDVLLDDLREGLVERSSKAIPQYEIEAFVRACPDQLDQLFEAIWPPVRDVSIVVSKPTEDSHGSSIFLNGAKDFSLPGCVNSKAIESSFSDRSTACESSPAALDEWFPEDDVGDGFDKRSTCAIGQKLV